MASSLLFTLFYIVISLCFVFPPHEFVSAGFTIQCLLSAWLGNENECFVQYHIRRTVATILCHSFLPLGKFTYVKKSFALIMLCAVHS